MERIEDCYVRLWAIPWGNTPEITSYTATDIPSPKTFKVEEQDMRDIAGRIMES